MLTVEDGPAALNAIGQHCQGSAYVQIITLHQTVLSGGAR